MARTSLLDRLKGGTPKVDWDKLNKNLADAREALEVANREQKQLALAAVMGGTEGHGVVDGADRLQKAKRRFEQAEAAIEGATDLQAAHNAAEAEREQAEADRKAKVDLDHLVRIAEEGERLLSAYADWWPKASEAWNAVQPHFATNPHLREDMREASPIRLQIPLELTRLCRTMAERPHMLPPGANLHALSYAHELEPLAKVYRDLRDNAFRSKR